jgi:hypothetical protein
VANNFPAMPPMQVAGLQYAVQIATIGGVGSTMPPGTLNLISYTFATPDASGVLAFDYTAFDQDAHESQMHNLLNVLCGAMAGNLGQPLAVVQAAFRVARTWIYSAATQVDGQYPGYTMSDQMPYP